MTHLDKTGFAWCLMVALVLLGCPSAGGGGGMVGGSGGTGWSESLTSTSPPESTFAARQGTSGGNPGRYRSIDLSNGGSMLGSSTCVLSLKEDAIYDPAEGSVTGIYMSLQAKALGSEFSSLQTAFSVAVVQGDDLYWTGVDRLLIIFADGWVDQQVTEADLRLFPSSTNVQAPDPEGEPLQFGFMTCVNGTRENSAVDNWIVRLCQ